MAQILIIYTTLRGKTGTMVEPVAEGMRAEGVEARILPVEQVTMVDMTAADVIIIGSRWSTDRTPEHTTSGPQESNCRVTSGWVCRSSVRSAGQSTAGQRFSQQRQ